MKSKILSLTLLMCLIATQTYMSSCGGAEAAPVEMVPKEDYDELKAIIDSLITVTDEKDRIIDVLRKENERLIKQISKLNGRIVSLKRKVASLQSDIKYSEKAKDGRIKNLEKKLRKVNADLAKAQEGKRKKEKSKSDAEEKAQQEQDERIRIQKDLKRQREYDDIAQNTTIFINQTTLYNKDGKSISKTRKYGNKKRWKKSSFQVTLNLKNKQHLLQDKKFAFEVFDIDNNRSLANREDKGRNNPTILSFTEPFTFKHTNWQKKTGENFAIRVYLVREDGSWIQLVKNDFPFVTDTYLHDRLK